MRLMDFLEVWRDRRLARAEMISASQEKPAGEDVRRSILLFCYSEAERGGGIYFAAEACCIFALSNARE
jgi:hypothetical protein